MKPLVEIEYCPKCGWMLRAAYLAQEILTTFTDDIYGVTLVPSLVSGRFQVRVMGHIVHDRKEAGGFAETKQIKQLVRDKVNPDKDLGHSDKKNV